MATSPPNNLSRYAIWPTEPELIDPTDYDVVDPVEPLALVIFGYAIGLTFLLIALVGLSGNSLVLYVIAKHNDMKTVTNYFIASLAVTDICLLVICDMPSTLMMLGLWSNTSEFVCKLMAYMQHVTVHATCLTLAAMTIDRYNLIVHAVRSRNTRTTLRAAVINILIWTLSFVFNIPVIVTSHRNQLGKCVKRFNDPRGRIYHHAIANIFLMYLLPLTVIVYCYVQILVQVWRKTSEGTESAQAQARALRRKKRITKMVAIVVVLFAICWAPLHVCMFLYSVHQAREEMASFALKIAHVLALTFAYANSAVNPFVYAFATTSFKKYFRRVFASVSCRRVGGEMMTTVSISMKTKTESLSVTQNGASRDDSSI